MAQCRPVRTQGRFLTPKVEARLMVDNKRFGTGKDITPPWSTPRTMGASFTLEFAKPQRSPFATYDRTMIQSKVSKYKCSTELSVTTRQPSRTRHGNKQRSILASFSISGNRKFKTLGVHAFSGRGPDGYLKLKIPLSLVKILKIQAQLLSCPMPEPVVLPFNNGVRTIYKRDALFVKLTADNGLCGYGPGGFRANC